MNREFEPSNAEGAEGAAWLLSGAGLRVETAHGVLLGHVLGPVYDFSARWDRPRALAVSGPTGVLELDLSTVERVDLQAGRIVVRAGSR